MLQSTINQLKPKKSIYGLISGAQRTYSMKTNEKDLNITINTNQGCALSTSINPSPTRISPSSTSSMQFRHFSTQSIQMLKSSESTSNKSAKLIEKESEHLAHNYHPLSVVLSKGKGVKVWDVDGNEYYDFLSAYSALNQGHSHPRLKQALIDQFDRIALTSRAFHSDKLGEFAAFMSSYFGYEKVLPMNTGAEAVETALKIARRWGYEVKGIPQDEAVIIACKNNFHGRTLAIISMSTDPEARKDFGPFLPGILTVNYNDSEALEQILQKIGTKVAAFLVEPIQGEAGVVVPDEGYLSRVRSICDKHNVLFIADEVQTGIGRTGKLMCYEYDGVRPDIVVLGKALSGGVYPVSAVLADEKIMKVITPGSHGSTYGGNPIACAVATEALKIVKEESLTENAFRLGEIFREEISRRLLDSGKGGESESTRLVTTVRGRGLLNAVVLNQKHNSMKGRSGYEFCLKLKENGLLAKQTHDNIIRFAPPLVITEKELRECIDIICKTVEEFERN